MRLHTKVPPRERPHGSQTVWQVLLLLVAAAGCDWDEARGTDQTPGNVNEQDGGPAPGDAPGMNHDASGCGAWCGAADDAGRQGGDVADAGEPQISADGSLGDAEPAGGDMAPVTCLPTAALTPGETKRTIDVGGVQRSYLLHVPPSYGGDAPVPLVLDWHGLFLSGELQRALSGYAELADREGFIVAFPDGIDAAWNVGPCCTTSREVDDIAFARALVAEIESLGCIDPERVYSAGYSNGGGMTYNLACHASDLFAAFAPAAFDLLAADEQPCQPSRPVTIIAFRGRDDFIVPYAGGPSNPPNGLPVTIHFRGAEATFAFWKEANGCTGTPTMANGCETYENCAAGVTTTLCRTDGIGGHLPGDPELGWATMSRYTLP